jgi:hypothetical protein
MAKHQAHKSPSKAVARQLAGEATGVTFALPKGGATEDRSTTAALFTAASPPLPAAVAALAAHVAGGGAAHEAKEAATAPAAQAGADVAGSAAAASFAAAPPPEAAPAAASGRTSPEAAAASQQPSPFASASTTEDGGRGAGAALDPTANPASMSRMNSMLTAVKHSISAMSKAVLPRMLRRQLDGAHSARHLHASSWRAGAEGAPPHTVHCTPL